MSNLTPVSDTSSDVYSRCRQSESLDVVAEADCLAICFESSSSGSSDVENPNGLHSRF